MTLLGTAFLPRSKHRTVCACCMCRIQGRRVDSRALCTTRHRAISRDSNDASHVDELRGCRCTTWASPYRPCAWTAGRAAAATRRTRQSPWSPSSRASRSAAHSRTHGSRGCCQASPTRGCDRCSARSCRRAHPLSPKALVSQLVPAPPLALHDDLFWHVHAPALSILAWRAC